MAAPAPRAVPVPTPAEGQSGVHVFAPRVVLNEGQRQLCKIPQSMGAIARALKVTRPAVSMWLQGERTPSTDYRRRIHKVLGIEPATWDAEPQGGIQAGEPSRNIDSDTELPTWEPDDVEDEPEPLEPDDADENAGFDEPEPVPEPRRRPAEDEPSDDARSVLDDYDALLSQLRKQLSRQNLPSRERIQISDAFSRALAHKERLERSREMIEARTIKDHPKWKELKAAIIGALLEHPAAARDVEVAITRVLGEERAAP